MACTLTSVPKRRAASEEALQDLERPCIERADVRPPGSRGLVELGYGPQKLPLLLKGGRVCGACGGGDLQQPPNGVGM
ncbi:hypothetical protein [Streptomyces sp. NPDC087859]|uniref:hypothetical protein n=1 Tax=Streptomyces sp. NPDC087859 TaxID=3365812 RepID=UPI0037F46C16